MHQNVEEFFDLLNNILLEMSAHSRQIIITGDFNIDLLSDSNHSLDFQCLASSLGLELKIVEPTRKTENSGTCLDNFITNQHNSTS